MSVWQKPWMVKMGARSKLLSALLRVVCRLERFVGAMSIALRSTFSSSEGFSSAWDAGEHALSASARARCRVACNRSFSSAVAARVKVLTRICSTGSEASTRSRSQRMVMEWVFPVPALASIECSPLSGWLIASNMGQLFFLEDF